MVSTPTTLSPICSEQTCQLLLRWLPRLTWRVDRDTEGDRGRARTIKAEGKTARSLRVPLCAPAPGNRQLGPEAAQRRDRPLGYGMFQLQAVQDNFLGPPPVWLGQAGWGGTLGSSV